MRRILEIPFLIIIGGKDKTRRIRAAERYVERLSMYAKQQRIVPRFDVLFRPDLGHVGGKSRPTASAFFFEPEKLARNNRRRSTPD